MRSLQGLITIAYVLCASPHVWGEVLERTYSDKIQKVLKSVNSPEASCNQEPHSEVKIDPCEDLAAFACQQGVFDDGTGSSWKGKSAKEYYQRNIADVTAMAEKYFQQNLKSSPQLKEKMVRYCTQKKQPAPTDEQLLRCAISNGVKLSLKSGFTANPFKVFKIKREEAVFGAFFDYVRTQLVVPGLHEKVKTVFNDTREALLETIEGLNFPAENKKSITDRVKKVKYLGTNCEGIAAQNELSRIDPLLVPNSYYDQEQNTFVFCNGYARTNTSEFLQYMMIAHELAHSFSPCTYSFEEGMRFPDKKIISCLRSKESIGSRKHPNPLKRARHGCEDQIDETYADYIATEVLVKLISQKKLTPEQYQKGFANTFRFADQDCNVKSKKFDVHPPSAERLNKIVLAHPQVRNLMGCKKPSSVKYCGSKSEE